MDDGAATTRVSGPEPASLHNHPRSSSYWLDACEDFHVDFAHDTGLIVSPEPGNGGGTSSSTRGSGATEAVDPAFFGGIEHILGSIKNGTGLPPPTDANVVSGNACAAALGDAKFQDEVAVPSDCKNPLVEGLVHQVGEFRAASPVDNGTKSSHVDKSEFKRHWHLNQCRSRDVESDVERNHNRARFDNGQSQQPDSCRREGRAHPSEKVSSDGRKRTRDWDERDRRERDQIRRVHCSPSWRDRRDGRDCNGREVRHRGRRESRDCDRRVGRDCDRSEREGKGYWQRDPSGTKDLVFRYGTYEPEHNREGKATTGKMHEGIVGAEEKQEAPKEKLLEEQARQYQLDVLEHAKKRNTIAFLETGAGKTLIAVLLMKSVSSDLQMKNRKMLAVFLVPKVPLVYQQAEVIRAQTSLSVGHYCGEMGQNFWDTRRWEHEFNSRQVLVMTAQILLNILRHSIIKMEEINLLILDECHHAVKKHPYSLVMSEFYHTTPKEKRPCIFGMTASPVNLKGVASQVDCAIKIRNLESKLDSIVCTVKDRKELEKHVPMPSEIVVEYDKAASLWSLHEEIRQLELAVEETVQSSSRRTRWQFMGARDAGAKEELHHVFGVSERTESDGAVNLIQKLRAINYALSELGQWCAYRVAQSFLTALQNDERANYQLDVKFQESHLNQAVSLLNCQLSEGAVEKDSIEKKDIGFAHNGGTIEEMEEGELLDTHVVSGGEHVDVVTGAAVAEAKVTPKVQSLIKVLLKYQHTQNFRAIIFVERVVTALVLPKVFEELPSLSFIKSASLIGHNNSPEMRTSQMQDTIAKFRDGRVTLLVATSVAEEGLDIRQCNIVIRFDLAKTVLAYIQSRGRARKPGSDYILMVERGNVSHEAFLQNARNSEETLRKEAIERTDISHLKGSSRLVSVGMNPGTIYQVKSTGAIVSLNSAVGLVHLYCSQLPTDRYSILRPEFLMEKHEKPGGSSEYSCKLQLPSNAPFEKLEGPVCSSMRLAQQAVCLAACQKLHEMSAFTDMLLPDRGAGEGEKADQQDEGDLLPGAVRHREFYPEGVATMLKGEWILSGRNGSTHPELLHLYMYTVKCENDGVSKDSFTTQTSDFSVLFGTELDAEVLSMSMELFIARDLVTSASLVFRGSIYITDKQLATLKSFHVRLMSIVLDVDVEPSTTPWDSSKAYLFVPLIANKSAEPLQEVDWDLIERIVETDAWDNPLHRARPDVYLGTKERALGGDKREYGFGRLRHVMGFGQKVHPTYGIRGAVAQFDVVKASGLLPNRDAKNLRKYANSTKGKLVLADCCATAEELKGRIITAAHSGKRFYVDTVRYEMTAENSFPRKEGYLGDLEYSSYADYYRQKK